MKRKGLKKLLIVIVFATFFIPNSVFANAINQDIVSQIEGGTYDIPSLQNYVETIVATIVLIAQLVSVGGIVGCGIYYMFAGASKKAELKKSLIGISVGCIILFASSTIVRFIVNVFSEITN